MLEKSHFVMLFESLQAVDIVLAAVVPLPKRELVMDFVFPYYSEYFTTLSKKPDPDARVQRNIYVVCSMN